MKINYFKYNLGLDFLLGTAIGLSFWPIVVFRSGDAYVGFTLYVSHLLFLFVVYYWIFTSRLKIKLSSNLIYFALIAFPLLISSLYALDKFNSFIHAIEISLIILLTASLKTRVNYRYLAFGILIIALFNLPFIVESWNEFKQDPGLTGFTQNRAVLAALFNLTFAYSLRLSDKFIYFLPASIIQTLSRTGMIVALIVIVIVIFIHLKQRKFKHVLVYTLLGIVLSVISIITVPNMGHEKNVVEDRFTSTSTSTRNPSTALESIKESHNKANIKFLGVGYSNATLLDRHFTHVIPIHLYTELGILVLPLFIGLILLLIKTRSIIILLIMLTSLVDPMFVVGTWGIPTATAFIIGFHINDLRKET